LAFYTFVVFLLLVDCQAVLIVAAVVRGEGVPLPAKVAIAAGVVAVPWWCASAAPGSGSTSAMPGSATPAC